MESVANYVAFYKVHKLKPIVNIKSFDTQKYISSLTVKYCSFLCSHSQQNFDALAINTVPLKIFIASKSM